MKIQVNGKSMDVPMGASVRQILDERGISPNVVACELNEQILKRAMLADVVLKEGDVLEILQMIGGG